MNKFFKIIFCTLSIVFSQVALSSSSNDMNFDTETLENESYFLDNTIANGRSRLNEWKVLKGLAGLLIGTKCFLAGSTGTIFFLMFPDKLLSEMIPPFIISSPVEKLLTNRLVWLSLSSTLTIFSLWLLKRSVANVYYGFNGTEDNIEYCNEC